MAPSKSMATAIDFAIRLPQLAYASVPWLLRQYVTPELRPRPPRGSGPIPEPPRCARPDWPALLRAQQPVVLTEEVVRWPAFERWTPAYLREALGAKRVPVLVSSAESRDFGLAFWYQKQVELRIDELIDLTFGCGAASDTRYYMWGGGGWSVLGALADDVPIPKEIDGRPLATLGSGIWIGMKGNLTSLHYDLWHGFLAQISGTKKVVLFPPWESPRLYTASPFGPRPAATNLPSDCLTADPRQFPKLFEAERYEFVLRPGEMLYIPPYWWHQVESLDNNVSLPCRYSIHWSEFLHPSAFPPLLNRFLATLRGGARRLLGRTPGPPTSDHAS